MGGGPLPGLSCVINTVTYPVREWRTTPGERLIEVWKDGFRGGMGEFKRQSRDKYFASVNMDASAYPYVRLRKATANTTAAAVGSRMHVFTAIDGSSNV